MRAELARNVQRPARRSGWLLTGYAAPDPDAAIAAFAAGARSRASLRGRAGHRQRVLAQEGLRGRDRGVRPRARHRDRRRPILYNAGLVRGAGRRRSRARSATWRRAQRADPGLAPVYPALVEAYRRLGDEAGATRSRARVPGRGDAREAGPARRAALRLVSAGRTAEASRRVAAALRLDPRSAAALSAQGYVRMAERRLDEAVQAQQAALAADPRYARAHWALAQIARARGDERVARVHLRAFVKLAPRTYEAWRAKAGAGRGQMTSGVIAFPRRHAEDAPRRSPSWSPRHGCGSPSPEPSPPASRRRCALGWTVPFDVVVDDEHGIVSRLADVDVLVTMAFSAEMGAACRQLKLVQVPGRRPRSHPPPGAADRRPAGQRLRSRRGHRRVRDRRDAGTVPRASPGSTRACAAACGRASGIRRSRRRRPGRSSRARRSGSSATAASDRRWPAAPGPSTWTCGPFAEHPRKIGPRRSRVSRWTRRARRGLATGRLSGDHAVRSPRPPAGWLGERELAG